MAKKLIYRGSGEFVPGVPAADHVCEDDKLAKELVDSGLYQYDGDGKKEPAPEKEG